MFSLFLVCLISGVRVATRLCRPVDDPPPLSSILGHPAPDLGLWRPLGNNVIENSSTSRAYQLNDCKNMHSIILQLKMSRNVAACYRPGMSLPLRRQKSAMGSMYFSFENERLPLQLVTMRIRFVRCAISIFGNEHLIRLSIVSL